MEMFSRRTTVGVKLMFVLLMITALSISGCGSLLRDMFDVTGRATRRNECTSDEARDREGHDDGDEDDDDDDEDAEDRERDDEAGSLRISREVLEEGRVSASVRRTGATDFRSLEDVCSQGTIRLPALAWIEVGEPSPRFDVSVRADDEAPHIVALRSEAGATTCVRVGGDRLARFRRTLARGRYQLLTDLGAEGTYDVVISSPR